MTENFFDLNKEVNLFKCIINYKVYTILEQK